MPLKNCSNQLQKRARQKAAIIIGINSPNKSTFKGDFSLVSTRSIFTPTNGAYLSLSRYDRADKYRVSKLVVQLQIHLRYTYLVQHQLFFSVLELTINYWKTFLIYAYMLQNERAYCVISKIEFTKFVHTQYSRGNANPLLSYEQKEWFCFVLKGIGLC